MTETKHFDPLAVASLSTGWLLTKQGFSAVHEVAEWVYGAPILTHQFPALFPKLRDLVLAQYPDMPVEVRGDWEPFAVAVADKYPVTIPIKKGTEAAPHPLDHMPDDKPVVAVTP